MRSFNIGNHQGNIIPFTENPYPLTPILGGWACEQGTFTPEQMENTIQLQERFRRSGKHTSLTRCPDLVEKRRTEILMQLLPR